jgi:Kdo2-lipid IVA lauroyltransferase/acyltransferase
MDMSLVFRLEAALARLLLALFRALGPVRASNFGGAVMRTIGPLLPVSRVADINLRLALPELDAAERRRVVRGAWENLGRTVGELPHVGTLQQTVSGPGWDVTGEATLHTLLAKGGPVIFVSGHIGNWEVLGRAAAAYGLPFAGMYRAAANPLIDSLITDLRRKAVGTAVPLFPKGAAGARAALAHLREGGHLALLMDQKMNDGIEATFFGAPAMTASAAAAMALRFQCPVVPGYVQRTGPARFQAVCEPPLVLPDSGDRRADVLTLTQAINDCLERWIRAYPESWLWMHRRWPKDRYR